MIFRQDLVLKLSRQDSIKTKDNNESKRLGKMACQNLEEVVEDVEVFFPENGNGTRSKVMEKGPL